MKKGKVFGKSQIAVAVMLLALGGAVWLNMSARRPMSAEKAAFPRWRPRLKRKETRAIISPM